jgi:hypothetical protein
LAYTICLLLIGDYLVFTTVANLTIRLFFCVLCNYRISSLKHDTYFVKILGEGFFATVLAALLQSLRQITLLEVKEVNCMSAVCISQECFPDTHAMHAMVQRERPCQPFEDDIVQPLLQLAVGGAQERSKKAWHAPFPSFW